MPNQHQQFLQKAIEKAEESVGLGGFPAGALIVKDGKIIGQGVSIGNKLNNPTSHGEMACIIDACQKLNKSELNGTTLYASMQPCIMCFGAAMWSGVSTIVFACSRDKVSLEYYGGEYDVAEVNKKFLRPIKIVHFAELEGASLEVVKKWESKNK